VAIDEHDVGVGVLEFLRCPHPGEAAAEDEHARARRDVVGRSHETSPTLGPAPPATIIHIG